MLGIYMDSNHLIFRGHSLVFRGSIDVEKTKKLHTQLDFELFFFLPISRKISVFNTSAEIWLKDLCGEVTFHPKNGQR